jgi:competence protein ComEA
MRIERHQLIALACLVGLVAALGWGWQWITQPTTQTISSAPEVSASISVGVVVVDVAGKVRHPGVVELPIGSRVRDAIAAAGGVLPRHAAGVNLARVLIDGEQIVVGEEAATQSNAKLNINRATASQLEELPGVGPVLAQRIVEYRQAHGGFRRIEELDAVSGVGPSMMSKLKDVVSVG